MILKLPDVRQKEPHSCGDAALRIVWDFHGVKSRPTVATVIDGTSPDTLEAMLWKSGLSVQAGVMDVGDLQYHTRRNRPVICCVTEESGVGHWVVVAGVAYRRVHYQCPVRGPVFESLAEWNRRWDDVTRRGVSFSQWGVATELPI